MKVYDENATEVFKIEQKLSKPQKNFFMKSDDSVPSFLVDTFRQKKKEGVQTTQRNRGFKHLTKVGFSGEDNKPIPRWAAD
jgi:hypothetical protein